MSTKLRHHLLLVILATFLPLSTSLAADVILNEYNAVASNERLDGGDGRDAKFGTIDGNGGNWFELIAVEDHVDMRGWQLSWSENEIINPNTNEIAAGVITLSNDSLWSDIRQGTILTFIETQDADGRGITTSTETVFDPAKDDWWINVSTRQEQAKGAAGLVSTTTNDGNPGDFSTGNDDWILRILNASGTVIFGPAGEGGPWAGGRVSNEEGAGLEGPMVAPVTLDTWRAITPASAFYDDTGTTSFGSPNVGYDDVTMSFIARQDVSSLRAWAATPPKSGDFNGDGQLTAADIDLLSKAVATGSTDTKFDLDNNGTIEAEDRRVWVETIKRTYLGDSNLDGEFGSGDLVMVFQRGQYEDAVVGNSGWADGDWNGDMEFNTGDLVAAFQAGGFERGPRAAAAAVPEPGGLSLLVLTLIAGCGAYRRAQA